MAGELLYEATTEFASMRSNPDRKAFRERELFSYPYNKLFKKGYFDPARSLKNR
jgi:hypothetical protein